jgi:hypothetical protein
MTLFLLEELPHTATGKLSKLTLRQYRFPGDDGHGS